MAEERLKWKFSKLGINLVEPLQAESSDWEKDSSEATKEVDLLEKANDVLDATFDTHNTPSLVQNRSKRFLNQVSHLLSRKRNMSVKTHRRYQRSTKMPKQSSTTGWWKRQYLLRFKESCPQQEGPQVSLQGQE